MSRVIKKGEDPILDDIKKNPRLNWLWENGYLSFAVGCRSKDRKETGKSSDAAKSVDEDRDGVDFS
jgi:hypothetical protein